jgi:hypothetical protein
MSAVRNYIIPTKCPIATGIGYLLRNPRVIVCNSMDMCDVSSGPAHNM